MKKFILFITTLFLITALPNTVFAGGGGCSGVSSPVVPPQNVTATANCPDYSNTASGSGKVCGDQSYTMRVNNTDCNGQIYFTVSGNGNDLCDWYVESVATGDQFAHNTTGLIGPISANTEGNIFNLIVDNTDNTNGEISIYQNGSVVAQSAGGNQMFSANIFISSATLTVHSPTGDISKTVGQCKDFIIQVPLTNNNFCSPLSVNLPWDIKCNETGATIASGVHTVVIDPKVPTSSSDLVDVSWNSTTCSWDVSGKNDCGTADIGTIFNISPDPSTTTECGNGTENFSVHYTGLTSGLNCWETAGPPTNITYNSSFTNGNATTTTSPYGGANNAADMHYPPSNTGGNATSLQLCIDVNNFCFDNPTAQYNTDLGFYVGVFVDGVQIYLDGPLYGTQISPNDMPYHLCLNLSDFPTGYSQTSDLQVYVFPNTFQNSDGVNTTHSTNCTSEGNWTADISSTLNVTFEETIGTPLTNVFPLNANYISCAPDPGTLTGDQTLCVGGNGTITTDGDAGGTWSSDNTGVLTVDNSGNITAVSSGSANVTYTVSSSGGCGDQSASIAVTVNTLPSYTVTGNDPTTCSSSDGKIVITGLVPNTSYTVSHDGGAATSYTSDASGNISIGSLSAGTYTNFVVASSGSCSTSNSSSITLTSPASPSVTANNASMCSGSNATISATGTPAGGTYSWDNGGGNAASGTVNPSSTTTYTVTYSLNGCTSNASSVVTVNSLPSVTATSNSPVCKGETINLTASGATNYSWTGPGGYSSTSASPTISSASSTDAGSYTVTGTDGNGCTNTASTSITVNPLPTYSVSGSDPTTCSSTDGALTITGLDANTSYTVSHDGGTATSYTSDGSGTITIGNLGAGTYTNFVVKNAAGCSTSVSTSVTLSSPASPSVTTNNASFCAGGSTTIAATGTPAGGTYAWDNGGGNAASGTVSPSSTTTYTVTYSLNGCSSTASAIVTVNSLPVVTATSNSPICAGETINLTASGATNYSWSGPGSYASTSATPVINSASSSDAGSYTVTGTDGNNCTNTASTSVVVNNLPTFTVSGSNPTTCNSTDGSLTYSGLDPNTSYTVTYTNGGNTVGPTTITSDGSGNIIIGNLGAGSYDGFSVTTSSSCSSTQNNTINLSAPSAPTVTVNDGVVCAGNPATLTAIGSPTGGAYSWSPAAGLSATTGATVTANPSDTTTYTVTYTQNGCTNTATATVIVNPSPTLNGLNNTYCYGDTSIMLTGTPANGTFIGDGVSGNTFNPKVADTGVHTIIYVVNYGSGCSDTASTVVTVTGPNADFTATPTTMDLSNTQVVFTNQSSSADVYAWNFGDSSSVSTDENPTHTFPNDKPGNYTVILEAIDNNGCLDQKQVTISIQNLKMKYKLPNVFTPNADGTNDFFKFVYQQGIAKIDLVILNRWGDPVFTSDKIDFNWNGEENNSGKKCTDGVYFYKMHITGIMGQKEKVFGYVHLEGK